MQALPRHVGGLPEHGLAALAGLQQRLGLGQGLAQAAGLALLRLGVRLPLPQRLGVALGRRLLLRL